MDDELAVTPGTEGQPAATESAPVEETAESTDVESPEKAQTTDEEEAGRSKTVPYSRLQETIAARKAAEAATKEAEVRAMRVEFELEQLRKQQGNQTQGTVNPEQQAAIKQLKDLGFVTKDEAAELARQAENKLRRESKQESVLTTLEAKYGGSDGSPKFTRDEVLAATRKMLSDDEALLEAAFFHMHKAELIDSAAKKAKRPVVASTKSTAGERTIGTGIEAEVSKARKTGNWADVLKQTIFPDEVQ